jgi:ribokinase
MKAIVVGDAGYDITVRVARRPTGDEKVVAFEHVRHAGGVGANTAAALVRLGAHCELVASVGDDEFGRQVTRDLARAGVDLTRFVRRMAESTYYSLSIVDATGEKALVVVPDGRLYPDADQLPERWPSEARWLHTVPYDPEQAAAWTSLASQAGVAVSIDLEPATFEARGLVPLRACLRGADTVIVNARAAAALGNEGSVTTTLFGLGVSTVLFTLGSDGVVVRRRNNRTLAVRPPHIDVVDTTGAGDALAGAYIYGRLTGLNVDEAARLGCIAGALACRRLGAQSSLPSLDELRPYLADPE